ncbi:helix-turn-helix domain-containing protein [Tenacibaculum maritimum]|uniref:Transposase, IS630/ISSod10 family, OrfA n=1 Tax=Tenacibaculum maritimum NCIMB 2154 TaxID=1349785 RepID=A0A2H1E7M9_9FLAO|nr:helix-turn-helix domain-containing protein [Tenacibaculum maritimum]SFZ80482.1 Transposase, IS630/ISSod10 family, OrfA [Tenacibaculum maritimum NCIMB 2154]SFZ81892.1 Transposase, IS630/ISSod10 family, OrfA [Tenacibaculum maritimum NCIMB 2154]SFZ82154.1 Transposase, IS630/ISSod10 family, OrfA [Tenacibaculum maritimum NCIMB 2154]SFZ82455.1 Transposase, IS630/ISSod10 family, OrfA [Tenacibaculum maritimum NCIMB 2154]SFZ82886.1 Transposase, IS630/ISSod10 family, OrfA [Tenacibaculum maritimum NCI
MGRLTQIRIREDLDTLESYKQKVTNFKSSQKLKVLFLISSGGYKTLGPIASILSINYSTLHRWLKIYREKGIDYYLSPDKRNRSSKIITPAIHKELQNLLNQERVQFNGYKDVQKWLEVNHGVKIEYQWLWKYLKTKLGTTLKVPRKSNVKKDKDASAEFFKTS